MPHVLYIALVLVLAFFGFYAVIMGAMCLAGALLARHTQGLLDAEILDQPADDMVEEGRVVRTDQEFTLQRWYIGLLLAALVLFYASLPVVLVGMVIGFVFLLLATVLDRRNTGDTSLLKASGGGITAVTRALFARTAAGSFGVPKKRRDCPKLFAAIDEVADRVDTEPPDELWISPGAEFSVFQEGRGPFGMFGSRKRVLTIGLCVMNTLTVSEFKSILAHEFAHFSHADTAWSRFLFQVTLSLRLTLRDMARSGGVLIWINPFYGFFWCYSKSYDLLSAGFSRSREFLADRMACVLYGSDVFLTALEKVCTDGVHFERLIKKNIAHHLRSGNAFVNMYHAFRSYTGSVMKPDERKKLHREFLSGEPSMFASHPTHDERVHAGRLLPAAAFTEEAPALTLFEKSEAVEQELTDFLTHALAGE